MELCPAPVIRSGYLNISGDFRFKKNYEIMKFAFGYMVNCSVII